MPKMFLSDCGQYVAIRPDGANGLNYDVIAMDGSQVWLFGRYQPKGWEDTDPRYLYPEFAHMVIAASNFGRTNRAGHWVDDFELTFADLDTSKRIEPLKGNCILQRYEARFRKSIRRLAPSRKKQAQ